MSVELQDMYTVVEEEGRVASENTVFFARNSPIVHINFNHNLWKGTTQ